MRKKVISLFLFTSCLLISGCKPGQLLGPKLTSTPIPTSTPLPTATPDAITDEEFSELAQEACQVFKTKLESIIETTNQLSERERLIAQAYLEAAEALGVISIIEEFAPQAAKMQSNLYATADAGVIFADDFDTALKKAEKSEGLINLYITEFGQILIVNWGAGETESLDISPVVVLNWYNGQKAVNEAAEALGLDACIKK
jgi:hypothetical protein